MKKLFKEDGFPSEDGLKTLQYIKNAIEQLFDSNLVSQLSLSQKRLLGSWLVKIVGDAVLNSIVKK